MTRLSLAFALMLALPAQAQEQQAGNAASTDTEATFQALIDKCDDVEALMLRSRIRLQLPRTTDAAAASAQAMMDEGFAICGQGDLAGAKAKLAEALKVAEAGASEVFSTDATEPAAKPDAPKASAEAAEEPAEPVKPWWQIW